MAASASSRDHEQPGHEPRGFQRVFSNGFFAEPGDIDGEVRAAWKERNLLTLDGGGIRGYWSLLALEKLMECIARLEEEYEEDSEIEAHQHSFHPCNLLPSVSQVLTARESQDYQAAENDEQRVRALERAKRFLPCHYFDYIGGSSTGGLIALMLGRLRMTVPDCKSEYRSLGEEIFGKPRMFTQLRFGLLSRTKYDCENLRRVFERVARQRIERSTQVDSPRFGSKTGMCRTFVTAVGSHVQSSGAAGARVGELFIIRSYECLLKGENTAMTSNSRNNTRQATDSTVGARRQQLKPKPGPAPRNPGAAHNFLLWEVARAATAAPFYFDPIRVSINGGTEDFSFEDGGLAAANNPTNYGLDEIAHIDGPDSIGTVVSVGTARGDWIGSRERDFITHKLKRAFNHMSEPDREHQNVQARAGRDGFHYFRLNPGRDGEGWRLDMELDEWKPRKAKPNRPSGIATIEKMTHAFNTWFSSLDVQQEFEECAQSLVRCRRLRLKRQAPWARFSDGSEYKCKLEGCNHPHRFWSDGEEYGVHLQEHHQVPPDSLEKMKDQTRQRWQYRPPPPPGSQ